MQTIEFKKTEIHNHASTIVELNARITVSNIKVESISSGNAHHSFIASEVDKLNDCTLSQIPRFTQLDSNIKRRRRQAIQPPHLQMLGLPFQVNTPTFDNGDIFLLI